MTTLQEILASKKTQLDLHMANYAKIASPVMPSPAFFPDPGVSAPQTSAEPVPISYADPGSVEVQAKADFDAMATRIRLHIDTLTKFLADATTLYHAQQADILAAYKTKASEINSAYDGVIRGIQK